ncbi:MAG: hypothetical protein ACJ78Q_13960, partial [Chloroflexia bacterium]
MPVCLSLTLLPLRFLLRALLGLAGLLCGLGVVSALSSLSADAARSTAVAPGYSASRPQSGAAQPACSGCVPTWNLVPSPNVSGADNYITGISASSSADVWAAGYTFSPSTGYHPLIERWDGGSWSIAPGPATGPITGTLSAVAAVSPTNVWAGGENFSTGGTLLMHYDGSAWSTVPITTSGSLRGITAISPTDIWAVGTVYRAGSHWTFTMHYDGASWSEVQSPNAGSAENWLFSVSGTATDDVWAVGHYHDNDSRGYTLVLHWNGSAWSVVPSPNEVGYNSLLGVAAISRDDAWAVGEHGSYKLILRWNGVVWNSILVPGLDPFALRSIVALGHSDVWAVGECDYCQLYTLALHFDGANWTQIPSPDPPGHSAVFYGVAAVGTADVWAAGDYPYSGHQTLIEHYTTSPCVTGTPTPTGTPPTATRTHTFTPTTTPTNTPTVTPTQVPQCGLYFRIVTSPTHTPNTNEYRALAAIAPDDVWAVGVQTQGGTTANLTEHWDGARWTTLPSPNGNFANNLNSVSASASNDVWAVGHYYDSPMRTMIIHWDGAQWTRVASPNPSFYAGFLQGVYSVNLHDAWAVGYYYNAGIPVYQTLIEHWDGTQWSIAPSPNRSGNGVHNRLMAVSGTSPADVWAVGYSSNQSGAAQTLIEHWDGTQWSIVP